MNFLNVTRFEKLRNLKDFAFASIKLTQKVQLLLYLQYKGWVCRNGYADEVVLHEFDHTSS